MTDTETKVHFRVVRFMHEAALKLHMKSVPLATAAVVYHKFFRENALTDYDPYLIGTTALYLGSKIEEEVVKLRDVVNICHRTLHKSKPPLEIGETFWNLRETVASCELFILRALRFKVVVSHPHKFLLHYLKFLEDWFDPLEWERLPIAKTSWSLLRDSYHGIICLNTKPEHMAVAVIYFALLCHGAEVPCNKEADTKWWKVFCDDININIIETIISELMNLYDTEIYVQTS
ncbi:cyclin-Q [Patella vulgata]|uniref:cyclin-Q n=1 Tax=Patella vulgata TaxID=6465 RepID=UPI00217FC089|nr:cyclin-Q [Patella vulgata]